MSKTTIERGRKAMIPPPPGDPIRIRCGRGTKADPHRWIHVYAGRHTPTRLFYRCTSDGPDEGPLRLDCEGKTWRRGAECGHCWLFWWKPEVQLLPIPNAPCCTHRKKEDAICEHYESIKSYKEPE